MAAASFAGWGWRSAMWLFIPTTAFLAVVTVVVGDGRSVLVAGRKRTIRLGELSQDAVSVAELPPWVGAVSMLSVLLWGAGAAIALFAAALVSRGRRSARGFFLYVGLLTMLLAVDDALLLHEAVIPGVLDVREELTLVLYAAALLAAVVWFPARFSDPSSRAMLLMAALFFAAAMFLDVYELRLPHRTWIEDSCKLLGIVGWVGFLVLSAARELRPAHVPTPDA
jgi:hypothetical protein